MDTFSICTSSSTSVLDTSADTSFDKEQRKISAHATLQVGNDNIVPFVYNIIADTWHVAKQGNSSPMSQNNGQLYLLDTTHESLSSLSELL